MRHPHGILTLRREDGRVVCERVRVADTWVRRLRGALFRRSLPSDEGCVLRPAFTIHTMFMQFPIDVLFLDQDLKVLKISAAVRPFRTASCLGAREVVELRSGECERRGLEVGDRVAWASYLTPWPGETGSNGATAVREPSHGPVLIASGDARFVKLLRFLLDARRVACPDAIDPDSLRGALEAREVPAAVVLDVGTSTAEGLATAHAARAANPDVPIFLAGDTDVVARAPAGTRIYDKWGESEALLDSILETIAGVDPVSTA